MYLKLNVRRILTVVICLSCICYSLQAQDYNTLRKVLLRDALKFEKEHGTVHPVLAEAYQKIGTLSFHQKDYPAAKSAFEREVEIRSHLSDTGANAIRLIKCRYNVVVLHQQLGMYREALLLAEKYLDLVRKHYGEVHKESIDAYQLIAGLSYHLHRLPAYELYTEKALNILKSLSPIDSAKLINLLILKAGGYIETGDYESGDLLLTEALTLQAANSEINPALRAKLYNNFGSLRDDQNRSIEALDYFRKALELRIKMGEERHPALIWIYDNMGVIHQKMKNYTAAGTFFEKALHLSEDVLGKDHIKTAEVNSHLGAVFERQNQIESALQYFRKAINVFQASLGADCLEQCFALQKMAEIYSKQNKYALAMTLCKRVEGLLIKHYGNYHPDLARQYFIMAGYAKENNDNAQYRYYLKKTSDSNQFPKSNTKTRRCPDKALYIEFITEWLDMEEAVLDFAETEKMIEMALEIASKLMGSAVQTSDKAMFLKSLHRFYAAVLCFYAKKSNIEGISSSLWEKAFYVMERSKSVLLSEVLTEHQVFEAIGISMEIKKNYRRIKNYTQYFEQQWFKAELDADETALQYFYNEFQYYQKQLDSIENQIKTTYPGLSFLGEDFSKINLASLREKLGEKEALLSYFVFDKKVFLIGFTKKEQIFQQLDSLCLNRLAAFLPQLFVADFVENNREKAFDDFVVLSKELARHLLPAKKDFLQGVSHLCILPDGVLSYLPFELLMSRQDFRAENFKNLPYLLKSYSIRYAYSFNTLMKSNKKPVNKGFLAIAPRYMGESSEHQPLAAANAELEWLKQRYKGRFISGRQIQKADLLQHISKASLIHLAAHAFAPDSSEAFLLLSAPDENGETLAASRLMMHEFAALTFDDVDLVVLSACRSGLGDLKQGEGVMSLGRAFAYAGVPAMLTTLWPLHDKSAEKLMQGFYRYLEKGYAKDEALRLAKLDFLQSAGQLHSHPLYWAAPVLWGNSTAIILTKATYFQKWWYIWAGGIASAIVFLFFGLMIVRNNKLKKPVT